MKVIFSHGKESGPWGSKISTLANIAKTLNFEVDSLDYTNLFNPDERVIKLNHYLKNELQPCILVGSSMGGYVSLVAAQNYASLGVFLIAPALFMPEYQQQEFSTKLNNIEIVHGWSDDVIPVQHSINYAQSTHCALHLINGDHRLNSSLDFVTALFKVFLQRIRNNHQIS